MNVTSPILNTTVRALTDDDLEKAHAMTQALHWPHTFQDWQQIVSLGTALVMELDNQVIGTACLVPQGEYATLGLIVINDKFQGHGLGRKIMADIMACAKPDTNLYLTATEMGKPLYQKLGFVEYNVIEQYQNVVDAKQIDAVPLAENTLVRDHEAGDAPRLQELMSQATGMNREAIVELFIEASSRVAVLEKQGSVQGYAIFRPFGRGFSIGPVIADSANNALALISSLLGQADGEFVRLDVSTEFDEVGETLSRWGLNKVDTVSQMAKGATPATGKQFIQFALATQAMG